MGHSEEPGTQWIFEDANGLFLLLSAKVQLVSWVVGGLDSDWIPENERDCDLGVAPFEFPNH